MIEDTYPCHERFFRVKNLQIAAKDWGDAGSIPVLALHGWLDNSASFDAVAPMLDGVHLVAMDMAGHGLSSHRSADSGYNIWQDVREILTVVETLGWDKFHLLGHSRGAIISALIAGSFPEKILSATLIDGLMPLPAEAKDAPEQLASSVRDWKSADTRKRRIYQTVDDAIASRVKGFMPVSEGAARALVSRGLKPVEGGYVWRADKRLKGASEFKLTEPKINAFLNCITCPVQLLVATDGLQQQYPQLLHAGSLIKNISILTIEGGHHLHMDQQAPAVADAIGHFLQLHRE